MHATIQILLKISLGILILKTMKKLTHLCVTFLVKFLRGALLQILLQISLGILILQIIKKLCSTFICDIHGEIYGANFSSFSLLKLSKNYSGLTIKVWLIILLAYLIF